MHCHICLCIILHFVPHALYYVIMIIICICARSRGANNESSSGARSPMGVRRSTSIKLRGANIVVIKASPGAFNQCPCILI
jgi:hypothetical protein